MTEPRRPLTEAKRQAIAYDMACESMHSLLNHIEKHQLDRAEASECLLDEMQREIALIESGLDPAFGWKLLLALRRRFGGARA